MTRKLIGYDGCEQPFCTRLSIQQVKNKLSASSLEVINLDSHIMFLDDAASIKQLPVNEDAMALARELGWLNTADICGNVLVAPDVDYPCY